MRSEMIAKKQAELTAAGVKFSPNEEAELIEKALGVEFQERPAKVVSSLGNTIGMVRAKEGFAGKIGVVAGSVLRRDAAGHYDPEYHVYFSKRDEDEFTGLHENTHAYVAETNSGIPQASKNLTHAVQAATQKRAVPEIDVEKTIVYRSVDEGLAQYGAMKTASGSEDFNREDLLGLRGLMLTGRASTEEAVESDKEFIEQEFDQLRGAIVTYNAALQQSGPAALQLAFRAERELEDSLYATGYYFTDSAMERLQGAGLKTGEALTTLAKSPPERVVDLQDPSRFSQALLMQKQKVAE